MADQIYSSVSPHPVSKIFNISGFEFLPAMAMKLTTFSDMMYLAKVY
jgi:hypothetical protein